MKEEGRIRREEGRQWMLLCQENLMDGKTLTWTSDLAVGNGERVIEGMKFRGAMVRIGNERRAEEKGREGRNRVGMKARERGGEEEERQINEDERNKEREGDGYEEREEEKTNEEEERGRTRVTRWKGSVSERVKA